MCLKRDYRMTISNLFGDAGGADLSGSSRSRLNHLVQTYLGIELDKSRSASTGGRRPLAMSACATCPTGYTLPACRSCDLLLAELESARPRRRSARTFHRGFRPPDTGTRGRSFNETASGRLGGRRGPNAAERRWRSCAEVYLSREALAEKADIPPMNVVQNRTLIELAQRQPAEPRLQPRDIFGLSPNGLRKYGDAFLATVVA
ncbi:MAG: HRDC domain-containing protein [Chloroflexi bacterium]|nr:HRDC domain-containing protein [Chloroflexota bacterium]